MLSSEGGGISVWSTTDLWDSVWSSSLIAATPAAKMPGRPARAIANCLTSCLVEIGRHLTEAKAAFPRGDNPAFLAWAQDTIGRGPGTWKPLDETFGSLYAEKGRSVRDDGCSRQDHAAGEGPDRWEPTDRFVQFENRRKAREAAARRRAFHEKKPRLGDGARRQRTSRGPKNTLPKFARSSAPPRSAFSLARKRQ